MSTTTPFLHLRYATLIDITVVHAYFAGGYCPWWTMAPSPACAAQLQGYRLQFRPSPMGGKVVGARPAVVPLPSSAAPLSLEFYLRITDVNVRAVTALAPSPTGGPGAYRYTYVDGAWREVVGTAATLALPADVFAALTIPLADGLPLALQLPFATPTVTWRYYVVTGANYVGELAIAQGATVISSDASQDAPELPAVASRFGNCRITPLQVTLSLSRELPAWYLVRSDLNGANGLGHVADVPPLPKPRPGDPPHVILDYAAILK